MWMPVIRKGAARRYKLPKGRVPDQCQLVRHLAKLHKIRELRIGSRFPAGLACDCHNAGHGPIRAGELIVVDIFPRRPDDGYWGDMTRTFLKGRASDGQRRLVRTVKRAHALSLQMISDLHLARWADVLVRHATRIQPGSVVRSKAGHPCTVVYGDQSWKFETTSAGESYRLNLE